MGAKKSKQGGGGQGGPGNQGQPTRAEPVPQSAFVIGDDDDSSPVANQTGAGETTIQPIKGGKPKMVEKVDRKSIYIAEKNKSQIRSFASAGDLYQAFEAGIPLQLIDYREFEGRVKKLCYDKTTVSVRQLQYVLARDYDDFVELVDPDSDISKIITGKLFEPPTGSKQNDSEESKDEVDHMGREIDVTRLLLFGLLYCKGSHEDKTERFWDILQQPGLDQISWQDKELTVAGTWMLEMATHWTHVWSLERSPEGGAKVKDLFGDLARVKDLTDEIYQNFLDDIFGNKSRVERDHFIECIEKNCRYFFNPEQLRQKVLEQSDS